MSSETEWKDGNQSEPPVQRPLAKALRDWSHSRSSSVVIFGAFKPDTDLTLACISTLSVRLPYEMCFINKFDLTWLAKWGAGWHVFFCGGREVVVGLDLILIYWPRAKFTHSKQILEVWRNAALIGSEFSVWFGLIRFGLIWLVIKGWITVRQIGVLCQEGDHEINPCSLNSPHHPPKDILEL